LILFHFLGLVCVLASHDYEAFSVARKKFKVVEKTPPPLRDLDKATPPELRERKYPKEIVCHERLEEKAKSKNKGEWKMAKGEGQIETE